MGDATLTVFPVPTGMNRPMPRGMLLAIGVPRAYRDEPPYLFQSVIFDYLLRRVMPYLTVAACNTVLIVDKSMRRLHKGYDVETAK